MKVIYGTGRIAKPYRRAVAAIGVFDAVHCGHQALIRRAVAEARRIDGVSVVVTFYPHPALVLRPGQFSGYVLPLEYRLRLIAGCGADVCVVIPFTKRFAAMSAEGFVRRVLIGKIGAEKVIVGEDFRFGCGRSGSFGKLRDRYGFCAEEIRTLKVNNINIKTKYIKSLIKAGDLSALRKFLGRDYGFGAEVESGDARGRHLGFPTANLRQENVVILPSGIYCVCVECGRKTRLGLLYIGTRPTFKKPLAQRVLEVHILDYRGNLYGKKLFVKVLKKIRNDKKFSDGESLAIQIRRDIVAARQFFSKNLS